MKRCPYCGKGFFDNVKTAITGRPRPSPKLKKFLEKYGDIPIKSLYVYRAPLEKKLRTVANIITLGGYDKVIKQLNYDDVFHLGLYFVLIDDTTGLLEKNEVIQINPLSYEKEHMLMPVHTNMATTLNILMHNAKHLYKDDKEFYAYNARNNNCQRFVYSLLSGSGLITPELEKFIMQDSNALLNTSPLFESIVNVATTLAEKIDILRYGGKLSRIHI